MESESVLGRAVTVVVDELANPVIHLDDLTANKPAAGRPQDLADAAALERVRRETRTASRPAGPRFQF